MSKRREYILKPLQVLTDKPNQIITGTRPTVGQLRSLQEDPVHILEMYLGLSLNK